MLFRPDTLCGNFVRFTEERSKLARTKGQNQRFALASHHITSIFLYQNKLDLPVLRVTVRLLIQSPSVLPGLLSQQTQRDYLSYLSDTYFTVVSRMIFRTGSTKDGDTESSSIPIFTKVSVSVVSAPSSPQMPTQQPPL